MIPSLLGRVNTGIRKIKDVIEGKNNLNGLVLSFVEALMQLPKTVSKNVSRLSYPYKTKDYDYMMVSLLNIV